MPMADHAYGYGLIPKSCTRASRIVDFANVFDARVHVLTEPGPIPTVSRPYSGRARTTHPSPLPRAFLHTASPAPTPALALL